MSSSESHATVTYTSISPAERSWSILAMDPFMEAALRALEQAPPSLDYVPGLKYPEYLAPFDDEIPDLANYPADGGDEEEESSEDDDDEEEHLALADSTAQPAIDPVPSAEETEPFEINESAATLPPPRSLMPTHGLKQEKSPLMELRRIRGITSKGHRNPPGTTTRDREVATGSPFTEDLIMDFSPICLKSPKEILATEKLRNQIEEVVGSGQLSHLVKRIKKERTKTFDNQQGEKKEKSTTPAVAPIFMINQEEACTRNNMSKSWTFKGREITFLPVRKGSNSSTPIIIKARIFGREVGRVHMDSGSSYEVIYEHCFLKLKPSIQASKMDSHVPLVRFS
nr:hypothetical protein [Tanacetum cinerariifolium]